MFGHHLKTCSKDWSRRAALPIALALTLCGCGEGAKFVRETDAGGVVTYPFSESGQLVSPFRKDAMKLIEEKCGKSFHIVREGETRGRQRLNAPVEGGEEMIRQRRWGIEFQCK